LRHRITEGHDLAVDARMLSKSGIGTYLSNVLPRLIPCIAAKASVYRRRGRARPPTMGARRRDWGRRLPQPDLFDP